jgi:amidophosphoribosyltransferase
MIDASVILGFRDPFGIKPLILGQRRRQKNCLDYMLASESVALDKLGFEPLRDIRPGSSTGYFPFLSLY